MFLGLKRNINICLEINGKILLPSKSVKLLGVEIDNKLNFLPHIETMCKKANKKINALFRIRNFISCDKARLLSSAYILSVFAYCPLIWMFCGEKGNNLINKTHKRALKATSFPEHFPPLSANGLLRSGKGPGRGR